MVDLTLIRRLPGFTLDFSLACKEELVVLFGPSGAGKSLVLQLVAGVADPDAGRIVINGRTVFDSTAGTRLLPQRRRVGYIPQHYALFPHLTVAENILYGLAGRPRAELERALANQLRLMRLRGLEERYPRELSGGQQQRVAVARALAIEPELLLFDEPFAALDSVIRGKLVEDLLDLHRQVSLTTLFVTHDLSEAFTLADRLVILEDGRVLQAGDREDVLYRPTSRAVARLVGIRNIFEGEVIEVLPDRALVRTQKFTVAAPPGPYQPGDRVWACIRPESVTMLRPGRPRRADQIETVLQAGLVREVNHGAVRTLFFKLGDADSAWYRDYDFEVRLGTHTYEVLEVAATSQWDLALKQAAIHVIGAA